MEALSSEKRINSIDFLRAIACVYVVLQHCLSYICSNYSSVGLYKSAYSYVRMVSVPLFFIISGYLLRRKPILDFYRKKAVKILIPFFTFTILKLIYSLFISSEFAHGNTVLDQIVDAFVFGNLYWFSYSIMIMFMVSPLIWKTVKIKKRGGDKELPVIAIVSFVVIVLLNIFNSFYGFLDFPNFFQLSRTLQQIPFFLLGYILKFIFPNGFWAKICQRWFLRPLLFLVSVSSVVLIGTFFKHRYFVTLVSGLLLAFISWIVVSYIKKSNLLLIVGKYTYQVFFLDSFFKALIFKLLEKIFNADIFNSFFCLFVIILEVILNILLSCLVAFIAKKFRVTRIAIGL